VDESAKTHHWKIAIAVGYFYQEIGDKLLIGAQQTLSKYGIDENNVDIFYAPGAFEIPLQNPLRHLAFLGCLKYAFSQHLNQTKFVHQHHRF
jgi:6,7-dimethyl-8-ribityllumazine synthase